MTRYFHLPDVNSRVPVDAHRESVLTQPYQERRAKGATELAASTHVYTCPFHSWPCSRACRLKVLQQTLTLSPYNCSPMCTHIIFSAVRMSLDVNACSMCKDEQDTAAGSIIIKICQSFSQWFNRRHGQRRQLELIRLHGKWQAL